MLEVERYRSDRHDAINDSEKKDRASQFNFQRVGERDSNYQPERSVPYYSSNRRSSRSRSPTYNYHERHYNDYGRDNFHGRNHHEGNSDRYREDRDRYRYKDDNDRRNERRGREYPSVHHNPSSKATVRSIAITKLDDKLPQLDDDPRFDKEKGVRYAKMVGGGRNTESFDPKDTLVRPDLRVIVGPNREQYGRPLKHDDVVIVPEFFCKEDDWDLYYKLVAEIRELNEKNVPNSQFIS